MQTTWTGSAMRAPASSSSRLRPMTFPPWMRSIIGGYPELHAVALEDGRARPAIAQAAEDGMPVWGECGGLVYLSQSLEADGRSHRMCGVLPADSAMTGGIRGLGYVDATCVAGPFRHCTAQVSGATNSTTRPARPTQTRGTPSASRAGVASVTGGTDSSSMPRSQGSTHA